MSPLGIIILSFQRSKSGLDITKSHKFGTCFSFTEDNDGSLSLAEFQKAFELLATSPTSSHKLRWQQTSVMGIDLAVAPQELSIKNLG